jgi:hypothetical protein
MNTYQKECYEVEQDNLKDEIVRSFIGSMSQLMERIPPKRGGAIHRDLRYKGEIAQELMSQVYKEYGQKVDTIPDMRFQIFPNGVYSIHVWEGKTK